VGVSAIIAIVSAVYTYTEMEKAQAKAHEAQAKRDAEADAAKGSIIPTELSASPLFIVYGTRLVGGVRSYNKILNNLNGGMPPAGSEFFPIGASKMRVDVSPVYNTEPFQYRELVEGSDHDHYVTRTAPVGARLMEYNKTAILDQYSCNHADSTGVYDGSTKL